MLATIFISYMIFVTFVGTLSTTANVGKARGVIKPQFAVLVTLFAVLHIAGLAYVATQL